MKKRISPLAVCCLLAVSACTESHSKSARTVNPDLKETTDWINQTYNPRPGEIYYKNRGVYESQVVRGKLNVTVDRKTTNFHIEGCRATLEENQTPGLELSSEVVRTAVQTFELSDIDSAAIKVEKLDSTAAGMLCDKNPNLNLTCDEAEIGLHTRNDRRAIKTHLTLEYPNLKGSDHQNISDSMDDSAFLFVNDLEYLPRLVAALKREIELCGGKPSAF